MITEREDTALRSQHLAVRRLTLTDFRCYRFLRLDADARPVVLTGPNGAGKTNLLEALSFLTPGRGLRRATLAEVTRKGAAIDGWGVAAVLDGPDGQVEIGTGRQPGTERRVVKIDGRAAKAQQLGLLTSALWLTPAMDRLLIEGAGGRRRFLDRLTLGQDAEHGAHAAAYEHAMRERTRLLKGGGGDAAWLAMLEDGMARHGVAMASARVRAAERLNAEAGGQSGPFPAARLTLAGEVEEMLAGADAAQAEDMVRAALLRARARDGAAGAATFGPHRTDAGVWHAAKDMPAGQCSTGEQKAVLVSIVLAQARVKTDLSGIAPLMLLDEVAAHLDEERRNALFDQLAGLSAQSWLTGTDAHLFAGFGDRAQFFKVAESSVAHDA
ncbi:DNA replication/repair protein RecF [Magnetospirillum moscoviense]|uniref:DNA replication/repair protein RecF n=1 Tax=Magnetospirillum moscoviense TaxID=1437059 RepID=UPI000AEF063A|nr:DNA replication/repair protein RecF [Magnetospirillum moscoviense]